MIKTYQEERETRRKAPQGFLFATIAGVYEDGVSLSFADGGASIVRGGQPGEGAKHYRCNTAVQWEVGMLALVQHVIVPGREEEGGTYCAVCPVGPPTEQRVDAVNAANVTASIGGVALGDIFDTDGKTARRALSADSAVRANSASSASSAGEAAGVTNYLEGHGGESLSFASDGRTLAVNVRGNWYWLIGG